MTNYYDDDPRPDPNDTYDVANWESMEEDEIPHGVRKVTDEDVRRGLWAIGFTDNAVIASKMRANDQHTRDVRKVLESFRVVASQAEGQDAPQSVDLS